MKKEKYIKVKHYKKSTYYTVQFQYTVAGITHTYSKTFSTMKEAVAHRDLKRAELITVGLPTTNKTLRQIFDSYHNLHVCSKKTYDSHKAWFKYIEQYADLPVKQITALDVQKSLSELVYVSENAIQRVHSLWTQLFNHAILEGCITVSPMAKVVCPKAKAVTEHRNEEITDEDFFKIIEFIRSEPHSQERTVFNNEMLVGFLLVAFYTGARPSEIVALEKTDIDLVNRTISINKAIGTDEIGRAVVPTKTALSRRIIPMSLQVELVFRKLFAMQDTKMVFIMHSGRPFTTTYVVHRLRSVSKETGIDCHAYMLRHRAAAKMVVEGNIDPRTAMELLGHSNLSTTLKTYAYSNEEKKQSGISCLVENGRKTPEKSLS